MNYGQRDPDEKHGLPGIVVANHPRGEVRHIIFTSPDDPLYLVPASFFEVDPCEAAMLTKGQIAKRTTSFSVGTHVEFGVMPGSNVAKWVCKGMEVLDVEFVDDVPRLYIEGVSSGTQLWTRIFGVIDDAKEEVLCRVTMNVPLRVGLDIQISYGSYEGHDFLPLDGTFVPTFLFYFKSLERAAGASFDIVTLAPWSQLLTRLSPHHTMHSPVYTLESRSVSEGVFDGDGRNDQEEERREGSDWQREQMNGGAPVPAARFPYDEDEQEMNLVGTRFKYQPTSPGRAPTADGDDSTLTRADAQTIVDSLESITRVLKKRFQLR